VRLRYRELLRQPIGEASRGLTPEEVPLVPDQNCPGCPGNLRFPLLQYVAGSTVTGQPNTS